MTGPLVSVVVPVRDGRRWLDQAVGSALAQTWRDLEVIVVDDGSVDGGADDLARQFDDDRLRVLRQRPTGVSRARNTAIAAAGGELVAFLDADDVWLPTKLERQVALFQADPRLGLVVGSYVVVDPSLRGRTIITPIGDPAAVRRWLLLEGSGLGLAFTGVVRRDVLAAVGGFDETLSTSADVDLATRVAARWPIAVVAGEPVALYRQHPGQMHRQLDLLRHDVGRLLGSADLAPAERLRGEANLHTRLFYAALAAGHPRHAARSAAVVLRTDARRLVALPARASVARADRWWRSRFGADSAFSGRV